ncbi:hypothetical protein [Caudoviricetes sp.]|nr:hypothetical protein [Caudoviricetes sp.]
MHSLGRLVLARSRAWCATLPSCSRRSTFTPSATAPRWRNWSACRSVMLNGASLPCSAARQAPAWRRG